MDNTFYFIFYDMTQQIDKWKFKYCFYVYYCDAKIISSLSKWLCSEVFFYKQMNNNSRNLLFAVLWILQK